MLREKVDHYVKRFLTSFEATASKYKYIHDPLWGTIEVRPHEQCLLDTPLLQRLRQIHQTGFVFATYPSATHTRFEHTLGVLNLAGRMAEVLIKRHPKQVDIKTEQKVRLAALLHDVGHSAFSHTTEEIYSHCSDILPLISAGGRFANKGAGEVLSYLIITSGPFRRYFSRVKASHPELRVDVDDFAPLILGKASNPEKQFEAEIISGAIDADKLDYFQRDGRAAGIEIAIDIDRLLHCLEIARTNTDEGRPTWALVVSRGGFNAIQQLLFARATLFSTVYHHHKVRSCDCMIRACFQRFADTRRPFKKNVSFSGVDLKSAVDFLHLTDVDFFSEAYNHRTTSLEHKLIHDILYRRLLKRVVTISSQTLQDFVDDRQQQAGYSHFCNLVEKPEERRALTKRIYRLARVNCPQYHVSLDVPAIPTFGKAGKALINMAPKNAPPVLLPLGKLIPITAWVDTYQLYYAQSFVFGPPDTRNRIRLARVALRILKDEFHLNLTREALPHDIRKDAFTDSR